MNELLLTPGPVLIPREVFDAMSASNLHHRTAEFEKLFAETLNYYQELVNSPTKPIFLACSGSGAMEASLLNACKRGDKILILEAGKFSERWTEIANRLELIPVIHKVPWGQTFDIENLKTFLEQNKDAKVLCCQYCETSTTCLHNVPEISKLVKASNPNLVLIVDAITAVGALSIDQTKLGIDILITGSQKALMLPPGLAIVSCSLKAWDLIENNNPRTLYFNLLKERKEHEKNTTAYTPAISLIFALNASLKRIFKETPSAVFSRHSAVSTYLRKIFQEMGFTLLAENCPSPSVTGVYPPAKVNADSLRKKILAEHQIRLAEGQDEFKGKIIRVGHMGAVGMREAERLITAVVKCLDS